MESQEGNARTNGNKMEFRERRKRAQTVMKRTQNGNGIQLRVISLPSETLLPFIVHFGVSLFEPESRLVAIENGR